MAVSLSSLALRISSLLGLEAKSAQRFMAQEAMLENGEGSGSKNVDFAINILLNKVITPC